jgi:hypothetical protein
MVLKFLSCGTRMQQYWVTAGLARSSDMLGKWYFNQPWSVL